LLLGPPNIEKSHFSPVDIFPSWMDLKTAGGEKKGMTEFAERWSRNYNRNHLVLSLFGPSVILTYILLIKKQ